MARILKIVFGIMGLLMIVIVSAPFWAPPLVNWNSQRERLGRLLSDAVGVTIAIDGDIEVESLFPQARLSIGGIKTTSEGSDESRTVSIGRVDVALEVWPLTDGVLDVERLHVDNARFDFSVDELGRRHWAGRRPDVAARAHDHSAEPGKPESGGEPFIRDIKLADMQISNGEVLYDNQLTQQTLKATKISLRGTLDSLAKPLELSGELVLNDRPLSLTAALDSPGRLRRGEGASLATTIDSALLQARFDLETSLSPHLDANGSVDVRSPSVGQLAQWLDRPLGQREDPGELHLSGRVSSTETRTTLDALTLSSADWHLTVSGEMAFDETPTRLSLNIEGNRIDLDRYLPKSVEAPRRVHFGPIGEAPEGIGLDDPIDLSVLGDLQGDVRIALDGLKVRDFEIGKTALRATLKDEVVKVELGELGLYDGRLVGQVNLDASGSELALDAKLAIDRVNLDSFYATHSTDPIIGGVVNGAINVVSRGGTPRALVTALNGSVLLELDPNQATEAAHSVISKLNLQLLIPEDGEDPYLLGRLVYNGKPITVDIETAPLPTVLTERGFPLDASLESDLAHLTYKGDVYRSPIVSFDGHLGADIPSAGRLAQWLGTELPQDPGAVTLKATFESDGIQGQIKEAYVKGKDLNAELSGDFDFSGALSKFNLRAKTGVLRLDRYLPPPAEDHTGGKADEKSERKTVLLLEDVSKEPLDLTAFRKLVGRVKVTSDGVVLPGTVVGGVAIDFHTDQGEARLLVERLEVNESVVTGSAQFDGRQTKATMDLDLKGTKIDFDTLLGLRPAQGDPSLGKGDMTVTAKASGGNLQDLLRTFAARADATLPSVRVDAGHSVETVKLSARADSLEDSFQASATGQLRRGDQAPPIAVSLDVTSDPIAKVLENEDFAFRANGRLGDVELEVQAAIESPLVRPKPDVQFHSAGDSLSVFAPLLDAKLPAVGPYSVAGHIAIAGERAELSKLDLSLGKSSVTGQLSVAPAGELPRISGQLAFQTLDLTEYYPHHDLDRLKNENTDASESDDEKWIFDADPLPFDLLSEAELTDFQVEIGSLKVDADIIFSDVSSTVSLKNQRLALSDLRARLYDGDLKGEFSADKGATVPAVKFDLKGTNLDYGVFLKAFDITKRLRGKVDTRFDLNGRGASLRAIASGLDGRIDLDARDGEIDRKMLGALAFGAGSILEPLVGKKDTGKLKCIVSTWMFEDGLGKTLVQYYNTSMFSMAGTGKVDLKTETLDLVYNPTAHEITLMKLAVPFRVSGSLQSPKVDVDSGGTLLEAAKLAGTVGLFLVNPAIGLGVLAGQTALDDRNGCKAAYKIQDGETQDVESGGVSAPDAEPSHSRKQRRRR
jgi:uncharacterized protein involved in outer membrane biogenesis